MSKKEEELSKFFSKQPRPTIDSLITNSEKITFVNQYDHLSNLEKELLEEKENIKETNEHILEVNPELIVNWEFHDRPENELGDLESLAKEFIEIGQQQPCIVRTIKHLQYKFELIAGERRWRAAKKAKLKLKIIVKDLDDTTAALVQAAENSQRKDLSDYAKGMSYAKLLEKKIIRFSDLTEKLRISNQQLSRLLSFSKLPHELSEAIHDFSKVSARTADELNLLCAKEKSAIKILIGLSDKIRSGKLGATSLKKAVKSALVKDSFDMTSMKVYSDDGRHLFTWRNDGNKNLSMSFPQDIRIFLLQENKEEIEEAIKEIYKKMALKYA